MSKKAWAMVISGLVLAMVLVLAGTYIHYDRETASLSEDIRRHTSGSFIKLQDGVVHYEVAGTPGARVVVLVHGFSVPYYIWDHTFGALANAGFRVLRYDLYGRGYSDRPDVPYDADLFDRQLTELLSGLTIREPVDLVGLSMGGPIVVTFADRHPKKVRTVSLFDPSYQTGGEPPLLLQLPLVGDYWMDVFEAPSMPDSQLADFYHPELFPDWPVKYQEQMRFKGFRRAILSTIRNFTTRNDTDEYDRLGKSGRPILLLWGEADATVLFDVSSEVLRVLPQAEFHAIEEAAHLPHYERPEVVNPILVAFLNQWRDYVFANSKKENDL